MRVFWFGGWLLMGLLGLWIWDGAGYGDFGTAETAEVAVMDTGSGPPPGK
jgi:hypothetical protein